MRAREGREEVPGTYTGEEVKSQRGREVEWRGPEQGGQRAEGRGLGWKQHKASRDEEHRPTQ